ncbi:MAG: DUF362 domain-containing protein [Desulfobulbus sp.]|nr:MAG: DUF362 domain-containing protein [Desulfobulbus sp.]RUM37347.1 MAG: DUF362 domain-containing protein [Desulfobulbus sp.]
MQLDSRVVALTSCAGYDSRELADCIDLVLSALGSLPNFYSCDVLLKPNLIAVRYGSLPCTEAAFIMSTARWFLDHGARVSVGDSPVFGTATTALRALGVAGKLTGMGVAIRDFSRVRKVTLPGGGKAGVAVAALDCDLLVNLPRVKAHGQTGVTLAVKNCFGCLAGLRKPWWHMVYGGRHGSFCGRLLQLLEVLPDSLTLADGIEAMHKTGPLHGESYPLKIVAGSANPVALDRALFEVLSLHPRQSPLMQECIQAGLEGSLLSDLIFPLTAPGPLQVTDFCVPEVLSPIRFDPFRFMRRLVRRVMRKNVQRH